MAVWVAVGDETGNWDTLANNRLGVAFVVAKAEDWSAALEEIVVEGDPRTINQRMRQPLQNLPEGVGRSSKHHVRDALQLWNQPRYSKPSSNDPLRMEVELHLNWLAKHPSLLTFGVWGTGRCFDSLLPAGGDRATLLGAVYGVMAAICAPFLEQEDKLLVLPGLRSEPRRNIADARVGRETPNQNRERQSYGDRPMATSATATFDKLSKSCAMPECMFGSFDPFYNAFHEFLPGLNDKEIPMAAIADLGATLLLFNSPRGSGLPNLSIGNAASCPNVWFKEVENVVPALESFS